MANKGQMTGMRGVYLVAAELTRLGFIVSVTSRSAAGADILLTDQDCRTAWSVQVKTNSKPANFWLLSARSHHSQSDTHIYVFVNLRGIDRPEYVIETSKHVAKKTLHETSLKGSEWYSFGISDRSCPVENWDVFGDPHQHTSDLESDDITSHTVELSETALD